MSDKDRATNPPVASPVGIRELNSRLSEYIDAVEAGREIQITRHGKPVARLVPARDRLAGLRALGAVRDPIRPKGELPPPVHAEGSVSDLIWPQSE